MPDQQWTQYAERYRALKPDEQARMWNALTPDQQTALREALIVPSKPRKGKRYLVGLAIGIILLGLVVAVFRSSSPSEPPLNARQLALIDSELTGRLDGNLRRLGLIKYERLDERLILIWDESLWVLIPYEDKRATVMTLGNQWDQVCRARGKTGFVRVSGYRSGKRLAMWGSGLAKVY